MKNNKLHIVTYTVYGILTFICLLPLFYYAIIGLGGSEFLFGTRSTVIITGSMEPTVMVNGVVELEDVQFEDIEVGDIIRYESTSGYSVLHRVMTKTSSYVSTQGDNNPYPDTFVVTPDQVTGRVVSINNDYAKIITKIFGKVDVTDIKGTAIRIAQGFLSLCVVFAVSICLFIVVFEMIIIHIFYKKYGDSMVEVSYRWYNKVLTPGEERAIIEKYFSVYGTSKWYKKVWLRYKFRRYYNSICNIEKEVNKSAKRLESLIPKERNGVKKISKIISKFRNK